MKAEQSGPVVPSAVEGFIAAGKDGRAAGRHPRPRRSQRLSHRTRRREPAHASFPILWPTLAPRPGRPTGGPSNLQFPPRCP